MRTHRGDVFSHLLLVGKGRVEELSVSCSTAAYQGCADHSGSLASSIPLAERRPGKEYLADRRSPVCKIFLARSRDHWLAWKGAVHGAEEDSIASEPFCVEGQLGRFNPSAYAIYPVGPPDGMYSSVQWPIALREYAERAAARGGRPLSLPHLPRVSNRRLGAPG